MQIWNDIYFHFGLHCWWFASATAIDWRLIFVYDITSDNKSFGRKPGFDILPSIYLLTLPSAVNNMILFRQYISGKNYDKMENVILSGKLQLVWESDREKERERTNELDAFNEIACRIASHRIISYHFTWVHSKRIYHILNKFQLILTQYVICVVHGRKVVMSYNRHASPFKMVVRMGVRTAIFFFDSTISKVKWLSAWNLNHVQTDRMSLIRFDC